MRAAAVCDVYELLFTLFTNCCFTNCCLCTAVYELCLCCLRSGVYDLLFDKLLFYKLLFYELLFYELLFTNCCFTNCLFTNCCFTNCCLRTAVYAVYDLLFTICCLCCFTNCCFTNCCLRTAVLRTSTTVQLPQPTVTAMTVIPLTNNHCTFALLTNHYFNYHYQRLLIATPQLSSLLLHMKKPLQFWRCHE